VSIYIIPTGDGLLAVKAHDEERFAAHAEECMPTTYSLARANIGKREIVWLRCDACGKQFDAERERCK